MVLYISKSGLSARLGLITVTFLVNVSLSTINDSVLVIVLFYGKNKHLKSKSPTNYSVKSLLNSKKSHLKNKLKRWYTCLTIQPDFDLMTIWTNLCQIQNIWKLSMLMLLKKWALKLSLKVVLTNIISSFG